MQADLRLGKLLNDMKMETYKELDRYYGKYCKNMDYASFMQTDSYIKEKIKDEIYFLHHIHRRDYDLLPYLLEKFLLSHEADLLGTTKFYMRDARLM